MLLLKKVTLYMVFYIFSFTPISHASEIPVQDLRGMDSWVKEDKKHFSLLNGFLAYKTGILEKIRKYGNFGLKAWDEKSSGWVYPAFNKPQDHEY